ncbi:uncharacterized protein HMPREF1541_10198 [Cyphellophora europaea CBS 101466]|uniref:DJ-1/PfpI domain-containing protein n=1 Tax=Cyphellophora europaea (strain CBS 101466) TaxID=1220924 RepID=W2S924_CYPE1|nr:uncharacterized protein HMPREF1541_10198 [Cyphellophora europaea CBS 101466]ETN44528.1 hypothetical protein HMPREF1541_10198 [Cyphellophora europaea CBS 101466]
MSAIQDAGDAEPVQVLVALHDQMNLLDVAGPLEVMSKSLFNFSDPDSKAFDITVCAAEPKTMTNAGIPLGGQISFSEAHKRLKEFDVVIIPGGNVLKILKDESEPLDLIKAYADLQISDPSRERSLLAVDTAALLLAKLGVLQGLAATTHPDYYIKMEHLCQESSNNDTQERTDVMEERYVVNHGRFEIGENEEENPYVFHKNRRPSNARKGSMLRKMSNARRESIVKRANMKLGGLRVITTGGPASGLDATLYLVSALVSHESAQEASRLMQYDWVKGVVVDAIDV